MRQNCLLAFILIGGLSPICFAGEFTKPGLYIVEPGKGRCTITEWYPGFEPRPFPELILTPDFFIRRMRGNTEKTTKPDILGPDGFTEEFKLSTLNDYESLKRIIQTGDIEKLKLVKPNSPILRRPSDEDYGPLDLAIQHRQHEMLEKLIKLGADCNAKNKKGFTPVHTAALSGTVDDLVTLFKYSANADNKLDEPRINRASQESIELAKAYGSFLTPLHAATFFGDLKKVKALLDKRIKINVAGELGWTPLHIAAIRGHNEIYHALLDAGADQFATDISGQTPVSYINDPEARRKHAFESYSSEWGQKYFGR